MLGPCEPQTRSCWVVTHRLESMRMTPIQIKDRINTSQGEGTCHPDRRIPNSLCRSCSVTCLKRTVWAVGVTSPWRTKTDQRPARGRRPHQQWSRDRVSPSCDETEMALHLRGLPFNTEDPSLTTRGASGQPSVPALHRYPNLRTIEVVQMSEVQGTGPDQRRN